MILDWSLQGRVWNNIKIVNDDYMICTIKKNGGLEVCLTNLIEVWIEKLTKENILHKCRTLNPLLNLDAFDCNDMVEKMLSDIPNHVMEVSIEQIKLRATVEGVVMKFSLDLSKGTSQEFWEIITKPLCLSSMELLRQHKVLLDLVKRKDEEIAEYKAEGAELIRKNIETKVFNEEEFNIDIALPNSVDCANVFQSMVNFYNTLKLRKPDLENSIDPSSAPRSCGDDTQNSGHDAVEIPGTKPSTSAGKVQGRSVKKLVKNKISVAHVIHKPPKKHRKGLNDFI